MVDAETVGQAVWDHVAAFWRDHDCATETSHGPHQCDRSCGADLVVRLGSAELDDLLARYEDFARSADGAGSLQSGVVTRLVEAVVGVLVASARLSERGHPIFHVAPCRWADAVGDLPPFGEFGCTCPSPEPLYQYDSSCREALVEGAIPGMRYAAHRLRALGDERTASWLFRDADKIEALARGDAPDGYSEPPEPPRCHEPETVKIAGAPDQQYVCDRAEGHTGKHHGTLPDGSSLTWVSGYSEPGEREAIVFAGASVHHRAWDSDNQAGHTNADWNKCDEWPCPDLTTLAAYLRGASPQPQDERDREILALVRKRAERGVTWEPGSVPRNVSEAVADAFHDRRFLLELLDRGASPQTEQSDG